MPAADLAFLPPQLTLLLVLEDRLHRQLTYDLLPSMLGRDPGVEGDPGQGWPGSGGLTPCPTPLPVPPLQLTARRTLQLSWCTTASSTRCAGRTGWAGRAEGRPCPSVPPRLLPAPQEDRAKLATFLESALLKHRGAQP